MKHFWKRLVACALTVVMLLGMMPPAAYAAVSELVTRSGVENAALLEALRQVYGDDAEAYLAVLEQYGLIDENGNFVTDEKIVMDGVEYTLDEITAILDDPATDLKKVVEVDGQFLTLEDLKTIVEIERYLAYLKATYFTEQDLTGEQIGSFYDLADAWANGKVKMLSARAGSGGACPVLTVTAAATATEGGSYTVTVTPDGTQTQPVTFSWRAVSGSADASGGGDVTIPAGSTEPVTLTVDGITAADRTKGDTTFLVQLYDLKNALFDNRTTRWQQTVTVAVNDDYCYYYELSNERLGITDYADSKSWYTQDFDGRDDRLNNIDPEMVQLIKKFEWLNRNYIKDGSYSSVGPAGTRNQNVMFGANLNFSGSTGIEFVFKFLFISYEKIFCSVGFRFGGPLGEWETIDKIWERNQTINGRPVTRMAMPNGQVMYAVDLGAQMESRDYVDACEQVWLGGQPSIGLFSLDENQNATLAKALQTGAYSYANPVLTGDGEVMFYLSDRKDDDPDSAKDIQNTRVAVSAKRDGQFQEGVRLGYDTWMDGYGDSGLKVAGNSSSHAAVWVRQASDYSWEGVLDEEMQLTQMNGTEIYAAVPGAGDDAINGYAVTRLTENLVPDLAPVVATNGTHTVVAWRAVSSSDTSDLTNFNEHDAILFRVYDGANWGETHTLYNGTGSGSAVKGLEMAMLTDGTAAVVYTLDTNAANGDNTDWETVLALMLTRKERIAACVAELQKLEQQQERYRQEKFRAYEDYSGGTLTKDAYLRQRADIDSKLAAAKAEQEAQEQLLSELEHLAFQDKAQEDDVFTSFAGATELTAELAGTFIKEVLVSSPTEIEIVWKFRDVFDMQGNGN